LGAISRNIASSERCCSFRIRHRERGGEPPCRWRPPDDCSGDLLYG
jgi:hypothetical protein